MTKRQPFGKNSEFVLYIFHLEVALGIAGAMAAAMLLCGMQGDRPVCTSALAFEQGLSRLIAQRVKQ